MANALSSILIRRTYLDWFLNIILLYIMTDVVGRACHRINRPGKSSRISASAFSRRWILCCCVYSVSFHCWPSIITLHRSTKGLILFLRVAHVRPPDRWGILVFQRPSSNGVFCDVRAIFKLIHLNASPFRCWGFLRIGSGLTFRKPKPLLLTSFDASEWSFSRKYIRICNITSLLYVCYVTFV